jgi:hypothetical protein
MLRSLTTGGTDAQYLAARFAELWGLPIREEFVETVAGEI